MKELLVVDDAIDGDIPRTATYGDVIDALGGWEGMLGMLVKEGILNPVVRQRGMESHVVYEIADRSTR